MEPLRPYLTVGTAYVATDWLLDFGLVTIPQPFAFALFTTRFGAVVLYSLFKLMHAYRVHSMNDGENTWETTNANHDLAFRWR